MPFVITGVLLMAYISLGVEYFQKRTESQTPDPQIMLQQRVLQKQLPDIGKLQTKLEEINYDIEAALACIPGPERGMDIYNKLLDMDRRSSAEVMSIVAGPSVITRSGNITTTILPYSLEVRGRMSEIMEFISLLIPGDELLQGLEITSINLEKEDVSKDEITLSLELEVLTLPSSPPEIPAKSFLSGGIK